MREPHFTDGWLIFAVCLALCAVVVVLIPSSPEAVPDSAVQAGTVPRAAVTVVQPRAPRVSAAAGADGRDGGRTLGVGVALLTVVGLVFVLISHDLWRVTARPPGTKGAR